VEAQVEVAAEIEAQLTLLRQRVTNFHQLLRAAPEEPTIGCPRLLSEYAILQTTTTPPASLGSRCPRCPMGSFGHAEKPGARFLGRCSRSVLSFVRCEVDPTTLTLELAFVPAQGATFTVE
jgi:hypothetical protein